MDAANATKKDKEDKPGLGRVHEALFIEMAITQFNESPGW